MAAGHLTTVRSFATAEDGPLATVHSPLFFRLERCLLKRSGVHYRPAAQRLWPTGRLATKVKTEIPSEGGRSQGKAIRVAAARNPADQRRIAILLNALGIDPESFVSFVEWALCEHLVATLTQLGGVGDEFFHRPDSLKAFRTLLVKRTGRTWSTHDLDALFERVKLDRAQHFRRAVGYQEYLKLLWQVPLECAWCRRRPPEVILHVDHIVPASRGGSSKRQNLQFLCADHNLGKSNKREASKIWLDLQ